MSSSSLPPPVTRSYSARGVLTESASPGAIKATGAGTASEHGSKPRSAGACALEHCQGTMATAEYPRAFVASCSVLGKRIAQEDRCVVYPRVHGRDDVQLLAVFDGTVGDHASDFAHHTLGSMICNNIHFKNALSYVAPTSGGSSPGSFARTSSVAGRVEAAVHEGFRDTDAALIRSCVAAGPAQDYAASTAAVALVTGDLLTVGHLGDSKVVLGRVTAARHASAAASGAFPAARSLRPSGLGSATAVCSGVYLTTDHKPDTPAEHRRIAAAGGTLEFLSGGRPFIRGGDFAARQAAGGRPMQLNYSRALGGKDLKPFGLSAVPDVRQVQLGPEDRLVIVASDGVWDVATADTAVSVAWEAFCAGRDPAAELADWSLRAHDARGSMDNITAVVAILR